MFSCFGIKNKKKKKFQKEEEEEEYKQKENELERLHIDSELLLLNAESYKIQSYFLDDFSNDYKHLIKNIQQEENEKYFSRNLLEIVSKENSNLKEIHQSLNSSVRIQNTNINEMCQQLEIYDDLNGKNKIEDELFLMENYYIQKENEIFNLESFLKKLKNYKISNDETDFEFYIRNDLNANKNENLNNCNIIKNKEDEYILVIKRLIEDELEITKEIYNQTTKEALNEKKREKEKRSRIEKIKNEIENLKNPQTEKNSHSMNNYNTMPNSNLTKNTLTNTDVNINNNLNSKKENLKNLENSLNNLNNQIESKQNRINNMNSQLNSLKSKNYELSNEWKELNDTLSNKFSMILKLEMKLDKIKRKKEKLKKNSECTKEKYK